MTHSERELHGSYSSQEGGDTGKFSLARQYVGEQIGPKTIAGSHLAKNSRLLGSCMLLERAFPAVLEE